MALPSLFVCKEYFVEKLLTCDKSYCILTTDVEPDKYGLYFLIQGYQ